MIDIRRASPAERELLLGIWQRSVRATHAFVTEDEIRTLTPAVRTYLASCSELLVPCDETGAVMGFMGMSGSTLESLFLAPEFLRRGVGRLLVRHAQALHDELTLDVNEENADARAFYEACGFVVVGRSELDDQGRPHPLLHMKWTRNAAAEEGARASSA